MSEVVGDLVIKVRADTSGVRSDIDRGVTGTAATAGVKTGKSFSSGFGRAVKGLLAVAGVTAIAAGAVRLVKSSIGEAREAQKVGATTTQIIKSTGGAAKVTAAQVGDMASALSKKIGVDDELIQSGANLILTFKQIRNEAGKGNDIFTRTTAVAADLAAAGFGSITSASKTMGKALNDPIKGVSALTRVGVTFTAQQQEQIKALVATGDLLGAQKLILKEVESQVGGVAAATATAGDKAKVAWGNVQETLGTALLPTLDRLSAWFSDEGAPAIQQFFDEMRTGVGTGGEVASVLGNIGGAVKTLASALGSVNPEVLKWSLAIGGTALAVGRLTPLVFSASAAVSNFVLNMRTAPKISGEFAGQLQGVGMAIRNLAIGGGLALVVAGITDMNRETSLLKTTLGGVIAGGGIGAMFGPAGMGIGAAIGGLVGGLGALVLGAKRSGDAAEVSAGQWQTLKTTLDQVSGAATGATRAMIFSDLEDSGAVKQMNALGISSREAVSAIAAGGPQLRAFTDGLRDQRDALVASTQAAQQRAAQANAALAQNRGSDALRAEAEAANKVARETKKANDARVNAIDGILKEAGATNKAKDSLNAEWAATHRFSREIKSLPKEVVTQIKALGTKPTIAQLGSILASVDEINRKAAVTVLKEIGAKPTKAAIDKVIAAAKEADRQKPDVPVKEHGAKPTKKAIDDATAAAKRLDGQNPSPRVSIRNFSGVMGNIRAINNALDYTARDRETHIRVVRSQVGTGATADGARGLVVNTSTRARLGEGAGGDLVVPMRADATLAPGVMEALRMVAADRGVGGSTGAGAVINVTLPTGDPEAAAMAVLNRLVAVG